MTIFGISSILTMSYQRLQCRNLVSLDLVEMFITKLDFMMSIITNFIVKHLTNYIHMLLNQYHLKFGMEIEWPMKNQNEMIAEAQQYFDGE